MPNTESTLAEMKETVYSLLVQSLERHAGSEAVVTPGKRSLSYAELGRQLDLARRGVVEGDDVDLHRQIPQATAAGKGA